MPPVPPKPTRAGFVPLDPRHELVARLRSSLHGDDAGIAAVEVAPQGEGPRLSDDRLEPPGVGDVMAPYPSPTEPSFPHPWRRPAAATPVVVLTAIDAVAPLNSPLGQRLRQLLDKVHGALRPDGLPRALNKTLRQEVPPRPSNPVGGSDERHCGGVGRITRGEGDVQRRCRDAGTVRGGVGVVVVVEGNSYRHLQPGRGPDRREAKAVGAARGRSGRAQLRRGQDRKGVGDGGARRRRRPAKRRRLVIALYVFRDFAVAVPIDRLEGLDLVDRPLQRFEAILEGRRDVWHRRGVVAAAAHWTAREERRQMALLPLPPVHLTDGLTGREGSLPRPSSASKLLRLPVIRTSSKLFNVLSPIRPRQWISFKLICGVTGDRGPRSPLVTSFLRQGRELRFFKLWFENLLRAAW
mmetsp:Transcript_20591/g.59768  ORF Transcript_20591/g.59768 Transcript_20591/m.59768 type:complete len:410 (-) Transcript_20591:471-1700(-)